MSIPGTSFGYVLALSLALASPGAPAAERKQWERLADCRYVAWQYDDGDSFRVRCGAREFVLRLYFVDAPEATLSNPERAREQRDYYGITLDDVLTAGDQSTRRVSELLRNPFVVWTRWASAGGRGKEPRYYGLVEAGGTSLGETLVGEGLARTKGVFVTPPSGGKSNAYVQKLRTLEADAKRRKLGAWKSSKK